tara:strand:+ start:923 stop:1327 length:405 start_codon:yes stop_codon:yes gene_type:complete
MKTKTINLPTICHSVLVQASEKAGVQIKQLVNMAASAALSSLNQHIPDTIEVAKEVKNMPPTIGGEKTAVPIEEGIWKVVCNYANRMEISPYDLMYDAILAQQANWRQMMPVSGRNFNSCRVRLFHIEQGVTCS